MLRQAVVEPDLGHLFGNPDVAEFDNLSYEAS